MVERLVLGFSDTVKADQRLDFVCLDLNWTNYNSQSKEIIRSRAEFSTGVELESCKVKPNHLSNIFIS